MAAGAIVGRDVAGLCDAAARVVVHAAAREPGARRRIKQARAKLFFAEKAERAPAARADAKDACVADTAHDVIARCVLETRPRAPGARAHGVDCRQTRASGA